MSLFLKKKKKKKEVEYPFNQPICVNCLQDRSFALQSLLNVHFSIKNKMNKKTQKENEQYIY